MSNLRFEAVSEASKRKPVEVTAPSERPSEFFGKKVFNRQKMYKYLPADVYEKLIDVIDNGARLDRNIANAVAKGIKQWADENGVTHYTHWFQPSTIESPSSSTSCSYCAIAALHSSGLE